MFLPVYRQYICTSAADPDENPMPTDEVNTDGTQASEQEQKCAMNCL